MLCIVYCVCVQSQVKIIKYKRSVEDDVFLFFRAWYILYLYNVIILCQNSLAFFKSKHRDQQRITHAPECTTRLHNQ